MTEIKEQVKSYILDNFMMGSDGVTLQDETSLLGVGVIDSTGVLELIAFLEEIYHIRVRDEEMVPENLDSLASLERYVQSKLQAVLV